MSKTLLYTLAIGLFSIAGYAQQGRLQLPAAYVQNSVTGNNDVPTNVLGSPYLDDEFKRGTVRIKDDDPYQAYMRYNAFHDEIEMQENNSVVALMKRDYVTARLGGDLFKIITHEAENGKRQGYMVVKKEGPSSFYLKHRIILKEGKEATSSYSQDQPPKFEPKSEYYIAFGDDIARPVKLNKKSIISLIPANKKEVEKYVKQEKLKLKTEQEVINLLNYYDSL